MIIAGKKRMHTEHGKIGIMRETQAGGSCQAKSVCASHFKDQNIKDFINNNKKEEHLCGYCGKEGAVSLKCIAEFIYKRCKKYYQKFDNASCPSYSECKDLPFYVEYERCAVPLDALLSLEDSDIDELFDLTPEQEKMLIKMSRQQKTECDTIQIFKNASSLVNELVKLENVSKAEELKIKDEITDELIKYYGKKPIFSTDLMYGEADKELLFDWERYSKKSIELGFEASKQDSDISIFFNNIIQEETIFSLLRPIYCEDIIYRCVKVSEGKFHKTFKDLTAPPVKYAKSENRMSRANVSMFYGAFEKETSVAECDEPESYTIGVFSPKKILTVLDLTDIPDDISMLGAYDYYIMKFLKGFEEEITKPVKENKEYVPTQLFVDFLRSKKGNSRWSVDMNIDGIIYDSAKSEDRKGTNVVLFYDNESSADILKLDSIQRSGSVITE